MTQPAPSPSSQPAPGPGWYPDAWGTVRWWDGQAWGPPLGQPRTDRIWAVLAHLSYFAIPVVAAVVIRLTVGRRDAFLRHHASEALNAQIWFAIVWNLMIGGFGIVASTQSPDADLPGGIFALFALAFLAGGLMLVGSIYAAVQADKGVWWRYPLPFRLVTGGVRSER